MSNKSLNMDASLHRYLLDKSLRETQVQRQLRHETAKLAEHNMQIAPEQGQFMQLLVKLLDARKIIEVGTFTGYSALAMALALPDDGELICCDVSEEWTAIARRYWREANVESKITLKIAPALQTLRELRTTRSADFDLIFLDADKENYLGYYEAALQLLKPGGLVLVDNTLWDGKVLDANDQQESTVAIREFNDFISRDERVDLSMLPVADGLTLLRKR